MKISLEQIKNILNDPSPQNTEELARQAAQITRQFFGRTISLYTPLYLSNYCYSQCSYCGFSRDHTIERKKLTFDEIHQEMKQIPVVCFGSHVNTEIFIKARKSGADETLARSRFVNVLPELIQKYVVP